jgi:rod shape-determining protein MreC
LSSLLRAWYAFLALGLVTIALMAVVGRVPFEYSAAVALPQDLLHRAGTNVRLTVESLVDRRDLRAEVERLEAELAASRQEARFLELEVQRLEEVLSVRRSQSPGTVATAPVVGGEVGAELARLIVGLGARDGVTVDMPVTVPQGLVGIVTDVGPDTALVRTILDPESRVGVTVRGKGGQGIAVGDVGDRVRVTGFLEVEPVEVGDEVETSSRGGLFPVGVLVGVVEEVLPQDPNELRRTYIVRPAVDLATLREVVLLAPQ